ncbi:hypothetical protein A0O36_02877 [Piscirickettsiaceae bacterium NZ-RLO1]|nr:hypothetical protein A0O36_02877 [Piscirickettsiaceae bacterium NZ-RLO1]
MPFIDKIKKIEESFQEIHDKKNKPLLKAKQKMPNT